MKKIVVRLILEARGRKQPSAVHKRIAVGLHEQLREFESETEKQVWTGQDFLPLDDTSERYKEVFLAWADHIIEFLKSIGYEIVECKHSAHEWNLTEDEIDRLAQLLHERWTLEKFEAGWSYGPSRNLEMKITPRLLPWASLSDDARETERTLARSIPVILASLGLEIIPLG